jgi:Uma2 family endonuclease
MRNVPRDRKQRSRGPVEVPPDFAIEVLSPGDYPGRVLEKADFYMRSGTELLWIVDPELESVTVYGPAKRLRFTARRTVLMRRRSFPDWRLTWRGSSRFCGKTKTRTSLPLPPSAPARHS